MRYKLIDYCNNKLYLYGKKDLFKYFDLVILSSNRKGNINNVIYEYKLNRFHFKHLS